MAGSRERARGLEELGAGDVVMDDEDPGGPFDLVLEGVGGLSLERSVRALSSEGVVVLYGAATQEPASIGLFDFAGGGGLGGSIRSFGAYATDNYTFGEDLSYLSGLIEEGRLVSPVDLEKNWRELGSAIEALRERRVRGQAVLSMDQGE